MKLLKRVLFLALALAMSVVMSVSFPLNVFAAGQKQYVEDLVVVYGKDYAEAKKNLDARSEKDKKTYYPVNKENSLNSYGDKYVLVGYSTTTDKSKAVTDLAFMNMLGGYDTGKYEQILKEQKAEMHNTIEAMMPAFEYFTDKYETAIEEGRDSLAVLSYDILDKIYNDDIIDDETGEPVSVAKMIVNSDDYTSDQFDNMFMQMSTMAFTMIQQYVTIGCMEDWVSLLPTLDSDDSKINYTAEETEAAQTLLAVLPDFQADMEQFYDYGYTVDTPKEYLQNFVDSFTDEEEKAFFMKYLTVEGGMRKIKYNGKTLLDAFMQDVNDASALKFLKRVVHCLPTEISGLLGYIGICDLFTYSFADSDDGAALQDLRDNFDVDTMKTVSVYAGVDRSIFDAKGVAVVDSAKKQLESGGKSLEETIKEDEEEFNKLHLATKIYTFIGLAVGIPLIVVGAGMLRHGVISTLYVADICPSPLTYMSTFFGNFYKYSTGYKVLTAANTGLGVASLVVGIIMVVAVCVLVIVTLVKMVHLRKETPERTSIPRIMVTDASNEKGKHDLSYYYCVKDSDGNCVDFNAGHGLQWNALYYTKDPDAGSPLTTDKVLVSTNSNDLLNTDVFTPAHTFDSKNPYNVNDFSGKSEPKVFFGFSCEKPEESTPTETKTPGGTATVLTNGTNAIYAAGGMVVGALTALGISAAVRKKKSKASE